MEKLRLNGDNEVQVSDVNVGEEKSVDSREVSRVLGAKVLSVAGKEDEVAEDDEKMEISPALAEMRGQWGVDGGQKDDATLKLERAVSWEELGKIADGLYELGHQSERDYVEVLNKTLREFYDKFGADMNGFEAALYRYNASREFGGLDSRTNFYTSMSFKDMRLSMKSGGVIPSYVYAPEGSAPEGIDANLVHVSRDTFDEDGSRMSGIDSERAASSDEVTFVFSSKIVKGGHLDAATRYPTLLVGVNLDGDDGVGVAVIGKDEDITKKLKELGEGRGLLTPIFSREEWNALGDEAPEHAMQMKAQKEKVKQEKLERLRREVLTDVDLEDVQGEVGKYLERVDKKKLEELGEACKKDFRAGGEAALKYYAEVFDTNYVPELRFYENREDIGDGEMRHERGVLRNTGDGTMYYEHGIIQDISVNMARRAVSWGASELVSDLGHEMWHVRQLVRASIPGDERGELYAFNHINYVRAANDIDAYNKQLIEMEAYAVSRGLTEMLSDYKNELVADVKEATIENVDIDSAMQQVEPYLEKMTAKEIFEVAGVEDYVGLLGKIVQDSMETIPKIVQKSAELLELRDVPLVTWTEGGAVVYDWGGNKMTIGKDITHAMTPDNILGNVSWFMWLAKQSDRAKDGSDERKDLYLYNLMNFVPKDMDPERNGKQLVVVESDRFADGVMDILRGKKEVNNG